MAKEISGEFEEVLGMYFGSRQNAVKLAREARRTLEGVIENQSREEAEGKNPVDHGMTLFIKLKQIPQELDDWMKDFVQYNGVPHSLYDPDSGKVAYDRRTVDGAVVIDQTGHIAQAGVAIPMQKQEYKSKYGIRELYKFLAEPLGTRKLSALTTSDITGDSALIMTLHEKDKSGNKEIRMYYSGDLIYSSNGHQLDWEYATRKPQEAKVIAMPKRQQYASHADNVALAYT
jgi:DNA integrity scanning protein DisA with diadenylate cyclase activity